MAEFVNDPVAAASLPRLNDDEFVSVDPNWLRVSLLTMAAVATAVLAVGIAIMFAVSGQENGATQVPMIIAAAVVALIAVAAVLRVVEVRHIAYQVRMHDISYRSGVLVRRVATVPFVRVQHARIRQGPLQRRFDIASLEVNSAGPDLKIHGLPTATAERLKTLVVDRAGDLAEQQ